MADYQYGIELHGWAELNTLLARFRPPELPRRMEAAMADATAKVLFDAATDAPRDTGMGAESLDLDWGEDGGDVWGRVYSPEVHMLVRELGRRPGQAPPPPGALLSWMSRHPAPPDVLEKYPTEKAREDALRWGIALHGSEPEPFLVPALMANVDYTLAALVRTLFEGLI